MQTWEDVDREILDILQNDFPLTTEPFKQIAERLNIREEEVISRIEVMKSSGLIRRIGGIMDSRNLGFHSVLCALTVPEDRIDAAVDIINLLPGVTHNYLRDHELNLWFTLTMSSQGELRAKLSELEDQIGVKIIPMPAQKVYKIKVSFDMRKANEI